MIRGNKICKYNLIQDNKICKYNLNRIFFVDSILMHGLKIVLYFAKVCNLTLTVLPVEGEYYILVNLTIIICKGIQLYTFT